MNENYEFDNELYSQNLNEQVKYIKSKINEADRKITSLKSKEEIINQLISRTNFLIEKYHEEKNYKLENINNDRLLTQFETLNVVHDILNKYEDQVFKYVKMLTDIENHKLNAFVKIKNLKKEEVKNDDDYGQVLQEMHNLLSQPQTAEGLAVQVQESLKLEGY